MKRGYEIHSRESAEIKKSKKFSESAPSVVCQSSIIEEILDAYRIANAVQESVGGPAFVGVAGDATSE